MQREVMEKEVTCERKRRNKLKCLQVKPERCQQQEAHKLRAQLEEMADKIREKDRIIKEGEAKLGHANHQLAMIEQVRAKFERQFQDFDQQLGQIQKSQVIRLKWSEGEKAPDKIFRWSRAVTYGTLYVKFASSTIVYRYNADGWFRLPSCP